MGFLRHRYGMDKGGLMDSDGLPPQQGICDQSGFKYPMSELRRAWDGALVHWRFLDTRNPQDFVRGVPDNRQPQRVRPEPADTFLTTNQVTPDSL